MWVRSWVGKIPEERNGNLFQYSCVENPMDKGAWWATAHSIAQSWTWLKWPSTHALYPEFLLLELITSWSYLRKNIYIYIFFPKKHWKKVSLILSWELWLNDAELAKIASILKTEIELKEAFIDSIENVINK